MATSTTKTNKPILPRGNDQSPKGYNRAALYSGKALDFDGVNDILTMPTALTSSLSTTSVTFVTNVKTDFATWTGTRDDAFSFSERGVILAFNNDSIYYYYRHQSASWRNLQVPNANFKPQEWNQMVTTIDLNTNTWKAYVNGVEVATSGTYSDTAIAYDANALTIGGQAGARFFDGQIAGFKIFNTALTAAQVADLYNNPEKVVPTGVDNTALKLWLPMMEGAGTTAYDGSGNGNHGTISGATYVHGVGSPVAQTAVIDWNKGLNLLTRSEEFLDADWVSQSSVTLTSGQDAPDGSTNAFKYNISSAINRAVDQTYSFGIASYTFAIYVKAIVDTTIRIRSYDGWSEDISINVADGWTRIDSTHTTSASSTANIGFFDASGSTGDRFYIWGASLKQASTAGPYVRTGATAQSSEVLLPQGLTSGRDITGVNLFENVRKQGALNLDGNSWAEVHDNASLDYSSEVTLEAWIRWAGEADQSILGKWHGPDSARSLILYAYDNDQVSAFYSSNGSTTAGSIVASQTLTTGNWYHCVFTSDGSTIKIYVNAVEGNSASYSGGFYVSTKNLEIGTYQTDEDKAYNGPIAQPRIYNRALTAEEVERNYNAGKNIYK